jgi:hypothetical protein
MFAVCGLLSVGVSTSVNFGIVIPAALRLAGLQLLSHVARARRIRRPRELTSSQPQLL